MHVHVSSMCTCSNQDALSEDDEMCHCWVHTGFLDEVLDEDEDEAPANSTLCYRQYSVTLTQPELDQARAA